MARSRTATLLLLVTSVHCRLRIDAPEDIAAVYDSAPLDLAPARYHVSGTVAVATSCPCDWPEAAAGGGGDDGDDGDDGDGGVGGVAEGLILLLRDGLCDASCSAARAICAASRADAKAVLLSCDFRAISIDGSGIDAGSISGTAEIVDDEILRAQRAASVSACGGSGDDLLSVNDSCRALPATYILANVSRIIEATVIESDADEAMNNMTLDDALNATLNLDLNATLNATVDATANATANATVGATNATDDGVAVNATDADAATEAALGNGTDLSDLLLLTLANVTLWRNADDDDEVDCTVYDYVPLVYAILAPIWGVLAVVWAYNTYRLNAAYAKDLHRLLCWVPTLQFVHGILSLFNYSSCPWEGTMALVYATFWAVLTILKEPVMLLCLLLVAKGWCITRNHLHRHEVYIAGTIVALLYAAVSIQLSVQSALSLIPMVIMYLAMLVDIATSIMSNLRILKAQLLALRALGVDPRSTPVHKKYRMFKNLARFTALFVVLEATIHIAFTERHDDAFWLFVLLHQLMELTVAVGIGWTFRAQPFNVHFQQVQQVATELADQLLPTITTVEVRADELCGSNLIAWRPSLDLNGTEPQLPATLVVLNPGDEEKPQVPMGQRGQRVGIVQRAPPPPPPPGPPPPPEEISSHTTPENSQTEHEATTAQAAAPGPAPARRGPGRGLMSVLVGGFRRSPEATNQISPTANNRNA